MFGSWGVQWLIFECTLVLIILYVGVYFFKNSKIISLV
jgi:hypothetical protein